jgi:lipoprotein-releasing system ATP-binding protein
VLELLNIHKSFTQNENIIDVLSGGDVVGYQGESVAITGASGVGKSTLLNIIGTLEEPSKGVVRFESRDINTLNEVDRCQFRNRTIGFVFQFHHLLPEFNALENTIIPSLIARENKKIAIQEASEMLSKVGLKERMNHRIGEMSGGEQQRVAIARALVMKPKLLLADEPTGNLDRITGDGIIDLLLNLGAEEGLSMVIATHNQRLAGRMLRQLEIVDGQIQ